MSPRFPGGFAVLMAVYGKDDAQLFRRALHSVFDNSLVPNEVWVVADGPLSKELDAVLEEFVVGPAATEMRVLRLPRNLGLAHALNAGLAAITMPWVVRADADDINLPNRFETHAALLKKIPDLDLQSAAILEMTKFGLPIAVRTVPLTEQEIRRFVRARNPFNHMAVAYRREKVLAVGGYPPVYLKEDYALWCQMLAAGAKVANSPEVLVHATAGKEMYKRRGGWKYAVAEWAIQRILVECKLKTIWQAAWDGVLRSVIFLMPSFIRGWFYLSMLRAKPPKISHDG